jgi:beta-xylosidase
MRFIAFSCVVGLISLTIFSACKKKITAEADVVILPPVQENNPIIRNLFTADPAALVSKDTFFVYTGHDEQKAGVNGFLMKDWHVFSSTNMATWKDHGAVLSVNTFSWAKADAWAGQCVEKNGKYYWYVPMSHKSIGWFSIGVAVSNNPTGPFVDAKGEALITDQTPNSIRLNIDPSVFVDDDGKAYLYWGGFGNCRMVKLKSNMIDLDGEVMDVPGLTGFTEAPWVHKRNGIYYMSFAAGFPETIDYATSSSPLGPWIYKGRLNDLAVNSSTNHQSIVEYKNQWYFVYHNGILPTGGEFRRSVCIETLTHNPDGTIQKIKQTYQGVPAIK